ncbi:hypothetical protein GE115_04960 [Agromyces sp. CFH 90414]|uniref:DUF4380 domain-containing protein n=1 Tax=Agromyces agglutinans TaxID=2662258 RepID=A0A6I2F4P4_9MICO|nr:hypothetical protein [Agromyces agglutinans]MRG59221.1 hypothetical protein [Agromyces agglutinans]
MDSDLMTGALAVRAGALELSFLPSPGGRLWAVRVDGIDLLWRDERAWQAPEGAWTNAGGSKAWPAPQDSWGGPPGPIDGSPFRASVARIGDVQRVTLIAAPDDATGLQVERRFDVPDDGRGFRQRTEFRNAGPRPVTWAIWEVCQVPAEPGCTVLVAADARPPVELGGEVRATHSEGSWRVRLHGADGKVGFPHATGRAGYRLASGAGFDWAFDPEPGLPHPDADSRVAVYARRGASFAPGAPGSAYGELEVMGALTTLAPGASTAQRIDWTVVPAP